MEIIKFFAFEYFIGVQNAYPLLAKIILIAISLDNVLHPPSRTLSPILFSNWLARWIHIMKKSTNGLDICAS